MPRELSQATNHWQKDIYLGCSSIEMWIDVTGLMGIISPFRGFQPWSPTQNPTPQYDNPIHVSSKHVSATRSADIPEALITLTA